ncbi:hypothetical protein METBIDRAFT_32655 [Metschnikowia bicuspidata var. bicuspidata NRRL YB-4993]|uniref:Mitochondrial intermembrane space import and assembly protein 40 n=1 Tax=Metschnikowia bicuspidata var. bicuspidata NRRL YB-4993 TaxID=869754 RepID=A0A1A0H9J9_9ASCO|nr:hypothetical protein METBIDRAFT_32655 [Metschnikowia bicuspidata var. bicuspidata NRRL YB-4993]OBA20691.1 hypothetical protein METBIDRAFT_32655 [Metschnikowia bicuspidata var. bicuspidata NRRL YB-4993]
MFRPVLRASVRHHAARAFSTARQPRAVPRTGLAASAGLAVLFSSVFVSANAVHNDTDTERLVAEQVLAENEAEREKTAFELTGFSEAQGEELAAPVNATEAQEIAADATGAEPGADNGGSQAAAFNPETGEINWDCPCLGGMADGPCGEEFKAAFACFVYSETEPKGIDCIGKFEAMRTCFRQHPEHYKEELYEDDEPVPSTETERQDSEQPAADAAAKDHALETASPDMPATEDVSKVA